MSKCQKLKMGEQAISESDLLNSIKDILKRNGYLNKLTAEMRAQVTELIRDRQTCDNRPPTPTEEILLVNELVKEYLEWNGYLYTSSVMTSEAAMPQVQKSRLQLCAEVGVKDDEKSSALPLLSNIVAAYTERIRRKINKCKKDTPSHTTVG